MPRLALYLLGPPRVERDGAVVKLDRRKALALLSYLAASGRSHRRDSLVNLLWPDCATAQGRAALRRTLHAPHSSLSGDWLEIDREEVGLRQGKELWVDLV